MIPSLTWKPRIICNSHGIWVYEPNAKYGFPIPEDEISEMCKLKTLAERTKYFRSVIYSNMPKNIQIKIRSFLKKTLVEAIQDLSEKQ